VTPTVAFFNNKGGVGKTTLLYHLAWMLREQGMRVLTVDLDPQANLTSAFVDDVVIESLWGATERRTVYGAIRPLLEGTGSVDAPYLHEVIPGLNLVPGDLRLAGAEQELSTAWPNAGDGNARSFRVLGAFATATRLAAAGCDADIALVDVGPNLGAINRAALIACDHVVVPLAPDLYSLQGLRNLGPTLRTWRQEWATRLPLGPAGLELPAGTMSPAGYVVLQHGVRLDRVVAAYDRWLQQVPEVYRTDVLAESASPPLPRAEDDPHCLGLVKHYHSLIPMAQEARRPVFLLRSADGAIGAHQQAVLASYGHFRDLAQQILDAVGVAAAP
jgi:chromosome partitioning protein